MKTLTRKFLLPILTTLLFATVISGCKKDTAVDEKDGVCPIVISTDPADAAINVPLDKVITATFNEEMDASTINIESFTITASPPIPGTFRYSGNTVIFTPTDSLKLGTTYTGRITTKVKDLNGNALQTDYVWTFSTGPLLAPMVINTDPVANEIDVAYNKVITASFSVPMDALTINNASYTLMEGTNPVAGAVSYAGTTATFTPTVNLDPNTVYTATITTDAKNTVGTPLQSDYTWDFTTAALVVPTVISTDPVNNAVNVAFNKVITANFSTSMDPATINSTTVTLKDGAVAITGVVSYSGTTATFTPSVNLNSNTTYTATITTGAKNTIGTPLASNYVWTFTTATLVVPTVTSTDPIDNAVNVALNKVITADFSTSMDPATINSTTVTLKDGAIAITGVVSYSGTTATFTPSVDLDPNTTYTATITTGAKNLAGTPLASNYVWTFTTGTAVAPTVISTNPVNNAVNVALNKIIAATFSTSMDPTTINTATVTLKDGAVSITGTVSYSGTTASFTPSADLDPSTTYTATITTGAKNLAGTPLVSNYVWSFTTIAPSGPPLVDLKSAGDFGILAGVGISNNAGFSEIHDMNVGISPGVRSSVTGFPPAIVVNGVILASDDIAPPGTAALLLQAKQDLVAAYDEARLATSPAPATVSGDQGGKTLAPGIYKSTTTLLIQSGDLTLDAQGNPNAVWIFQVASAFTTVGGAGGNVILSGGAQAKNVFWQVGSSATIGDFTIFKGNVLALSSITMGSGSTAQGRMLARNGSVVLTNGNTITKP